jgi:hypothetical protein
MVRPPQQQQVGKVAVTIWDRNPNFPAFGRPSRPSVVGCFSASLVRVCSDYDAPGFLWQQKPFCEVPSR